MAKFDQYSLVDHAISLAPATYTATTNGTGVDLQGFHAATVLVTTGTITDGTHAISLEESDDNTNWSAVASGDILGTLPSIGAANDNATYRFGYIGTKRYIRVVSTVSGATSGGVYSAVVLRGRPENAPTA